MANPAPRLYDVVSVVLLLPSVVLIIMIQQADCYTKAVLAMGQHSLGSLVC